MQVNEMPGQTVEKKYTNSLILKNEVTNTELRIDLDDNTELFDKIINLYFKTDNNIDEYDTKNYSIIIWKNNKEYMQMYSHNSSKLNSLFQLLYSEILN